MRSVCSLGGRGHAIAGRRPATARRLQPAPVCPRGSSAATRSNAAACWSAERHWRCPASRRHAASEAAASPQAAAGGDAALRRALHEAGPAAAARNALGRYGRYAENEVAWDRAGQQILEEAELATSDIEKFKALVRVLVDDVGLTQGKFWESLSQAADGILQSAPLEDLVEIAKLYTKIEAWRREVFDALIMRVRVEMAVHTMEPNQLGELLAIFSRAGTADTRLSRSATQLFNEAEDRILDGVEDFTTEDCLSVVESMARFRAAKVPVMQLLGRERLHASLGDLSGEQVASLCHAYGQLEWRHDTVFRTIVEAITNEFEAVQRRRVSGVQDDAPAVVKYSVSDVALVALAMLQNKMHRGNTAWFKWGDRYRDLLDILYRRLDEEMDSMGARPLAAASFVLGRARRGTEELHQEMFTRMTHLLEGTPELGQDRPQDELPRFLHGLAMMGPTRNKNVDTQWLMQWLCRNVYTFTLSDFIVINRHLVAINCCDKEYLQMLVPFFCDEDRMSRLTKTDVMELTNTYNGAHIREEEIPDNLGRHFFWALGRRFQHLHARGIGKSRPPVQRLG